MMYFKLYRYKILLLIALSCADNFCFGDNPINFERTNESSIHLASNADTAYIMQLIKDGRRMRFENPDSAFSLFVLAERLSKKIYFNKGLAWGILNQGIIASEQGKYQEAAEYFRQAYPYCEKEKIMYALYVNLGYNFFHQSKYRESSYNYYEALKQMSYEGRTDDLQTSAIYNNLSTIHVHFSDFEQALIYAEKAEKLVRKLKKNNRLPGILNSKGNVYITLNRFDDAMSCFQSGLSIAEEHKDYLAMQVLNTSIGALLLRLKKPKEAVKYLERSTALNSKVSHFYFSTASAYFLADAYCELKNYKKAEALLIPTLKKAKENGMQENMLDGLETLAKVYERTERYKEALEQQKELMQLRDTILNKEKIESIKQLEMKHQITQQDKDLTEKELLISQQDNKLKTKDLWIGGILSGMILLVILLISYYRINKQKQKVQERQIQIMHHEQEIMQLKAMISGEEKERTRIARELHDGIVSQLLAIKLHLNGTLRYKEGQTLKLLDFKDTLQYLEDATKELRKTAHNLMPEDVLKGGLVIALDGFCKKIMVDVSKNLEFQSYGNIPRMDAEIELSIYRIVQELVQNAIKHSGADHILVQLNGNGSLLSVTVEDNGCGCPIERFYNGSGFGLKNVKTRIKALGGEMDLKSEKNNGTTVYIEFSVNPAKENQIYAYQVNDNR